jgi:cytoskeletal protein RodZ
MSVIRRTNQGGSVGTFIVVGILLAAGLIGSVYYLKLHGVQIRIENSTITSEQQQTNKDKETTKSQEETDKTNATKSDESKEPNNSTKTDSTSEKLPISGPELAISELVGVFLLTMVITSYLLSRRELAYHL